MAIQVRRKGLEEKRKFRGSVLSALGYKLLTPLIAWMMVRSDEPRKVSLYSGLPAIGVAHYPWLV